MKTPVIWDALGFARNAHKGQTRKLSGDPYVVHPHRVGLMLKKFYPWHYPLTDAGFLHDVIEDTPHTKGEIQYIFGMETASLVWAVTNRPNHSLREHINDEDVMRLKVADVIDNIQDTILALQKGQDAWSVFKKGRGKIKYWKKIADMAEETIGNEPIHALLLDRLAKVEESS